jgi:Meckel syndrome type 1 protein
MPAEPRAEAGQPAAPAAAVPLDPAPRTPPLPPRPAAGFALPARQVAPFAVALALGPDSSLTLTLDPAELGRVEVAIERSQGEAAIRVTAERPETLALLQRDSRELERALADIGLGDRAPTLSFGLGQGGAGDGGGARDMADRHGAAPGREGRPGLPAVVSGALPVPAVLARRGAAHRGLIDLAV